MTLLTKWKKRRNCFHHDRGRNSANTRPGFSWVEERFIDTGMRKMFWCTHCGKTWYI